MTRATPWSRKPRPNAGPAFCLKMLHRHRGHCAEQAHALKICIQRKVIVDRQAFEHQAMLAANLLLPMAVPTELPGNAAEPGNTTGNLDPVCWPQVSTLEAPMPRSGSPAWHWIKSADTSTTGAIPMMDTHTSV